MNDPKEQLDDDLPNFERDLRALLPREASFEFESLAASTPRLPVPTDATPGRRTLLPLAASWALGLCAGIAGTLICVRILESDSTSPNPTGNAIVSKSEKLRNRQAPSRSPGRLSSPFEIASPLVKSEQYANANGDSTSVYWAAESLVPDHGILTRMSLAGQLKLATQKPETTGKDHTTTQTALRNEQNVAPGTTYFPAADDSRDSSPTSQRALLNAFLANQQST